MDDLAETEPFAALSDKNSLMGETFFVATPDNSTTTRDNHLLAEAIPSLARYKDNGSSEAAPSAATSGDDGLAVCDDNGHSEASLLLLFKTTTTRAK